MLSALAIALLCAASPVGVALSSNRPGADAQAAQALARTEQALGKAGVPGLLSAQDTRKQLAGDPKNCAGGRKCLHELALQLGAQAVLVGVDVARVADDVVVHLEAVSAEAEAPLAVKDATVRLKAFPDGLSAALSSFSRELLKKLTPSEAKVASDTPVAEPAVTRPTVEVETGPLANTPGSDEKRIKGTTVAGVMTGAAAIVAGAIAVAFSVLAANDQAAWEKTRYTAADGSVGTTLSAADAQALVNQGNARFTVALGTGIGAGALAITSVILLTR